VRLKVRIGLGAKKTRELEGGLKRKNLYFEGVEWIRKGKECERRKVGDDHMKSGFEKVYARKTGRG